MFSAIFELKDLNKFILEKDLFRLLVYLTQRIELKLLEIYKERVEYYGESSLKLSNSLRSLKKSKTLQTGDNYLKGKYFTEFVSSKRPKMKLEEFSFVKNKEMDMIKRLNTIEEKKNIKFDLRALNRIENELAKNLSKKVINNTKQ